MVALSVVGSQFGEHIYYKKKYSVMPPYALRRLKIFTKQKEREQITRRTSKDYSTSH